VRLGASRPEEDAWFDIADPVASPEETLVSHETAAILASAVAALPERQRGLIVRHFGLNGERPITQAAFAREEGISRQRAKQIVEQGIAHLRHRPEVLALAPDPGPAVKSARRQGAGRRRSSRGSGAVP
jgi:DNA-directed RNA polymerase sigma subunit (sigma70/sigma32)